jgi:hypothetical protein
MKIVEVGASGITDAHCPITAFEGLVSSGLLFSVAWPALQPVPKASSSPRFISSTKLEYPF